MWDHMKDPNAPPAALSKKRKKRALTYPMYGLAAVREKIMREYLARSSTTRH
jgi:hypothetical protein